MHMPPAAPPPALRGPFPRHPPALCPEVLSGQLGGTGELGARSAQGGCQSNSLPGLTEVGPAACQPPPLVAFGNIRTLVSCTHPSDTAITPPLHPSSTFGGAAGGAAALPSSPRPHRALLPCCPAPPQNPPHPCSCNRWCGWWSCWTRPRRAAWPPSRSAGRCWGLGGVAGRLAVPLACIGMAVAVCFRCCLPALF